ncbi:MAG: phosphatase PAP2 family protein [Sphingobacteriales bacterium]|nr:MAG: phosphatase PAP2 family protein [Sphingobacteriales bacterium]
MRSAFLFFYILIYCGSAKAQWLPKDSTYEYCTICHGGQHLIGQPYNHALKLELPLLLSSAAVLTTGFLMQASDKTKPFTEVQLVGLDKNTINSFDSVATGYWNSGINSASDYMLIGISFLPVLFLTEHHCAHDFKSLLIMTAETFAFNYGTTYIVKSTVNRPRPYVYNTSLPDSIRTDKESRQSFYSGHTSQTAAATFLFAKVISDFHPYLKPGVKTGIWAFAITVPAVEAYFRVKGGKHYPTDVITGYALGALSGWLIPELHRNRDYHRTKKTKLDVGLMPSKGGMVMNMNLQF